MSRLSFGVVIGFSILAGWGCDLPDDFAHKRKLEALVQKGARKADVAAALGPGYTMYVKGTPSWDALQSFLQREPAGTLRPLRDNSAKYPVIMYYTTAWRMTWIFFDETDKIHAYYLTAQ